MGSGVLKNSLVNFHNKFAEGAENNFVRGLGLLRRGASENCICPPVESLKLFFTDDFPNVDVTIAGNSHEDTLQEGGCDDIGNREMSPQIVTTSVFVPVAAETFIHDTQSVDQFFTSGFDSIMRVSLVQSKHGRVDVVGEELNKESAASEVSFIGREDIISMAAVFAGQVFHNNDGLDQFGVSVVENRDFGGCFGVWVQGGIHLFELLVLVLQVHFADGEWQLFLKQGNPRSLGCTEGRKDGWMDGRSIDHSIERGGEFCEKPTGCQEDDIISGLPVSTPSDSLLTLRNDMKKINRHTYRMDNTWNRSESWSGG